MSNLWQPVLDEQLAALIATVASLPLAERVEALNTIRSALHAVSPFQAEPVDCVQWIRAEQVRGNDYNPNHVAPPEMRLLKRSIDADGYTQPVVGMAGEDGVEVVDGFHRTRVAKEDKRIRERIHGYVPVVLVQPQRAGRSERIAATIRHNRARGVHGVVPMTDIVAELVRSGLSDAEVGKELGMDADEVLRFKQAKGLPELFKDHEFGRAWE
jgi:ParB-like chromosome segregation protein Spo0J